MDIAVQYGKGCHPTADDKGKEASFNVNLVKETREIIQKSFNQKCERIYV